MTERVELVIDGLPFPNPRAQPFGFVSGGRVRVRMHTPSKSPVHAWRALVKAAWMRERYGRTPWTGPVSIELTLYLPRPKKLDHPRYSRAAIPCTNPQLGDWDNHAKAITDALTDAGAWKHDGLIFDARTTKYHHAAGGCPGARIVLSHNADGPDLFDGDRP